MGRKGNELSPRFGSEGKRTVSARFGILDFSASTLVAAVVFWEAKDGPDRFVPVLAFFELFGRFHPGRFLPAIFSPITVLDV